MTALCDRVTERIALGEPLGDLSEHAATCARCNGIVALPTQLGATRRDVDPGLGFSARMTVGAQHRLVVRRRRRIAGGMAAGLAAAAAVLVIATRTPKQDNAPAVGANVPVVDETAGPVPAAELKPILQLANTKRTRKLSAHWARIQQPLKPYRTLVNFVPESTP